jgi:hypothetical protein
MQQVAYSQKWGSRFVLISIFACLIKDRLMNRNREVALTWSWLISRLPGLTGLAGYIAHITALTRKRVILCNFLIF